MIYYKLLFFFVAGFHVIFCRPELKFDETGNVLDANEFKTEEKPMDFLKLVASKVREAKTEDDKVDENKTPIEKDPKVPIIYFLNGRSPSRYKQSFFIQQLCLLTYP